MRAVAQRVKSARIEVGGDEVASMAHGLLALVGVAADDGVDDARELARKLVHLRVFADEVLRHRKHGPCRDSGTRILPTPKTGGWR